LSLERFSQGKLVCFNLCIEQQLLLCQRLLVAVDYFHMAIYKLEQPVVHLTSHQEDKTLEVPAGLELGCTGKVTESSRD